MSGNPPRLLDLVRLAIRRKHYSIRTEEAYVNWIKRFILFHPTRHPGLRIRALPLPAGRTGGDSRRDNLWVDRPVLRFA
jgi:hypothetical protein